MAGASVIRTVTLSLAIALVLLTTASSASAAVITVTGTGDTIANDGECTFREAITSSNADNHAFDPGNGGLPGECDDGSGDDLIGFVLAGNSQHVISPATSLPDVTATVVINAVSEVGEVVIDGSAVPSGAGLNVTADNSVVRHLTFGNWVGGIQVLEGDGIRIRDCFLGTDRTGSGSLGNGAMGLAIEFGAANTEVIDNVISGNDQDGIRFSNEDVDGTRIIGNRIGTDAAGTTAIPNDINGIRINAGDSTEIGGDLPTEGNLISGNGGSGIQLTEKVEDTLIANNLIGTDAGGTADLGQAFNGIRIVGDVRRTSVQDNVISGNDFNGIELTDWISEPVGPSDTRIQGNLIGTDSFGEDAIGNGLSGVLVDSTPNPGQPGNLVGGTLRNDATGNCTGDCNVIANNGNEGVGVSEPARAVAILGNDLHDNDDLGIDLYDVIKGPDVNDPGDPDTGANDFQNFPVIEASWSRTDPGLTGTWVTGRLDTEPATSYRIEFFSSDTFDPAGQGEGQRLLGSFNVTTGNNGIARFGEKFAIATSGTSPISATATRLGAGGSANTTSEFSVNNYRICDESGNNSDNSLTADGTGETLCGFGGDDLLKGSVRGDIFDGGNGSDTADLSLSPNQVAADLAAGKVTSSNGVDLLIAIENLTASSQADTVTGDQGANVLEGGAGSDTIDARAGTDTVRAGQGDDVIDVEDGVADALIDCGPGADTVTADPTGTEPASSFVDCETVNRPDEPPPTCQTDPSLCPPPTCETDASLCPEPPPVKKCDGVKATIVGTNKPETINGTSKRDVIVALGGNDKVKSKAGNDLVCAGDGNDTVKTGDGNDRVLGQSGKDVLRGEGNKDKLNGGEGADKLFGYSGKDVLKGGPGTDRLEGGSGGKDRCDGGKGRDRKSAPGCEGKKRIV